MRNTHKACDERNIYARVLRNATALLEWDPPSLDECVVAWTDRYIDAAGRAIWPRRQQRRREARATPQRPLNADLLHGHAFSTLGACSHPFSRARTGALDALVLEKAFATLDGLPSL